jgi:FKBP-type peptidyl-prolyl cis-trans isomerase FkpA/FKBP-type peptidyl-prolyl cis-trans isomerase FklB
MNKCYTSACASMLVVGAVVSAFGPGQAPAQAPSVRNPGEPKAAGAQPEVDAAEEARTLYALGVLISRNLEDFQLTPEEFERVQSGLNDGFNHRAKQVDLAVDTPKVQALRRVRMARTMDKRLKDGQAFVEKAAALPGARKTPSGLVMVPIKPGKGASPTADDAVLVRYQGKLVDGTVFDAAQGEPVKFALHAVVPCWSEALPLMKIGEKSRIVCPPNLAYGLHGAPPKIASQSTLDFEVELVAITPAAAAAPPSAQAPPTAAAPGRGAAQTPTP